MGWGLEARGSRSGDNVLMRDILAMHDLSSYGKSSLNVIMPVLEALGSECSALPTAILSTQSDGFDDLYMLDLSDTMRFIFENHKKIGLKFDALYSGFLGSSTQIKIVEEIIKHYGTFTLVDPVLGDGGKLYQTMNESSVKAMRSLMRIASLITPNYTEALLLTDSESSKDRLTNKDVEKLVAKLKTIGPDKGVITSVPIAMGMCNVAYSKDDIRLFSFEEIGVSYPGSGDLFASLLLGLTMREYNFFSSVKIATEIASFAIAESNKRARERRRGIMLDPVFKEIRRMAL